MYTITHNTKYVDKHTRAGADGKQIICPLCFKFATVYHFSWSAIACGVCHANVEKQAWILK